MPKKDIRFLIGHINKLDPRLYEALLALNDSNSGISGTVTGGITKNYLQDLTLVADTMVTNDITEINDADHLDVILTWDTFGYWLVTWDSSFSNAPTTGLLGNPSTLSVVQFVGRLGRWYCTGFITNLLDL